MASKFNNQFSNNLSSPPRTEFHVFQRIQYFMKMQIMDILFWLKLVVILNAFRRSYRLHCETAFNMDDTAQIEKSRVGKFDLTYMKSFMYLQGLLARKRVAACFAWWRSPNRAPYCASLPSHLGSFARCHGIFWDSDLCWIGLGTFYRIWPGNDFSASSWTCNWIFQLALGQSAYCLP